MQTRGIEPATFQLQDAGSTHEPQSQEYGQTCPICSQCENPSVVNFLSEVWSLIFFVFVFLHRPQ